MTFLATVLRDNIAYGIDFDAPSWSIAERMCLQNGWKLDGEKVCEIAVSDELVARIAARGLVN